MREVIVRPDAETDIEDCADYTTGEWGHEQARKYVRELRRGIEGLAATALRYPLYDEVYPGLRRKRSGKHHIELLRVYAIGQHIMPDTACPASAVAAHKAGLDLGTDHFVASGARARRSGQPGMEAAARDPAKKRWKRPANP